MAGILIAYQLQKAGKQVIVLEANRIGSGQTRNTTAKITSQHGLKYNNLIHSVGKEKAKQYAMANEAAIQEYKRIVKEEKIFCDFEEIGAYVYSSDKNRLKEELKAAASLGLPASIVSHVELPFNRCCALRFDHQTLSKKHPVINETAALATIKI